MPEFIQPYHATLFCLLVLAGLLVIQFAVADVAGIRAKHVPGMPITGGHSDFLFRATRAYANSYENLGLLLLLVLLCLFSGAHPAWTAVGTGLFTLGRAGHMCCYYADWRLARSVFFGLGALGQLILLGAAALALL